MSMKMFRQFQKQMEKVQEELKQMTVEATAGGGAVKVVATGDQRVVSIDIDPSVIDPEDAEFLSEMILVAVNDAMEQSQELAKSKLGGLTGGLNIPGLG
ncbi:MAG: YbaB/EbfC family nucleoid-associated protein [Chloroflexota bacterium]|nr:YbaB/EbfC family nucleoid-associated protein [Chloroflexota bacterium]MDE2897471.1 YbaB/EbfC family nucleoid-associated protein [Chloroflexota bacterium]